MGKLRVFSVSSFVIFIVISGLAVSCIAQDQPGDSCPFFPNQEVRVTSLGSLTAPSKDAAGATAAAVEAILHEATLCCGKDSALGDLVFSEPRTLKELGTKLQGRHL